MRSFVRFGAVICVPSIKHFTCHGFTCSVCRRPHPKWSCLFGCRRLFQLSQLFAVLSHVHNAHHFQLPVSQNHLVSLSTWIRFLLRFCLVDFPWHWWRYMANNRRTKGQIFFPKSCTKIGVEGFVKGASSCGSSGIRWHQRQYLGRPLHAERVTEHCSRTAELHALCTCPVGRQVQNLNKGWQKIIALGWYCQEIVNNLKKTLLTCKVFVAEHQKRAWHSLEREHKANKTYSCFSLEFFFFLTKKTVCLSQHLKHSKKQPDASTVMHCCFFHGHTWLSRMGRVYLAGELQLTRWVSFGYPHEKETPCQVVKLQDTLLVFQISWVAGITHQIVFLTIFWTKEKETQSFEQKRRNAFQRQRNN